MKIHRTGAEDSGVARRGFASTPSPRPLRVLCASAVNASLISDQSALDPTGPQAARIGNLWWLLLVVCSAVFLLVIAFTLYSVVRSRRRREPATDPGSEKRMARVVVAATALTVLI